MTTTSAKAAHLAESDLEVLVDSASPPFIARYRQRTFGVWVLLGLLALVILAAIVEDPVAHVWYESRQHQLASETGTQGLIPVGHQAAVLLLQYPATSTGGAPTTQQVYVAQGTGAGQLRGGPGHAAQTPLPGQRGNSVIFGHRADWGAPFARLGRLIPGDQLQAQNVDAYQPTVYVVKSVRIVRAGDRTLLGPTQDFRLTLVSDAGGRTSGRWLVVTAISGAEARATPATGLRGALPSSPARGGEPALALLCSLLGSIFLVAVLRHRRTRAGTIWALLAPLLVCFGIALVLLMDGLLAPLA